MFSRIIRDFKISRNHKKRVNSVVIRSNEDIIRALDVARANFLEADRLRKEDSVKWKAVRDTLEWLINVAE